MSCGPENQLLPAGILITVLILGSKANIKPNGWLDFCCENINTKPDIMKKIALMFFCALVLFSCKKENEEFPANPDWLTAKISQMETADYYMGTKVYAYEWKNEYYYLISIPISSCIMCEFYNYHGVKVVWTQEKIDDFHKNARRIKVVWQRDLI